MNIRQIEYHDVHRWDEYVNKHHNSTPYHLLGWAESIQNVYKHPNVSLVAEINREIHGILPLTFFRIPLRRPRLIALPFCDAGSLLADDSDIEVALLQAAMSLAKKTNAVSLELRGSVDESVIQKCDLPVEASSNKVRMILELPDSSDQLWNGFKSKLRSQIRKSEKNGLEFVFPDDGIDEFYEVFSANMRDLGSPVHARQWIRSICVMLKENTRIALVYLDNAVIGCAIVMRVGDRMSVPWASTLRTYNHLGPNMLLYWNLLKFASDTGCRSFDFGRSTPSEGTYRFKKQWGAHSVRLEWRNIHLQGAPSSEHEKRISNIRPLVVFAWQNMPLFIANRVGPTVRKYISL